MYGDLIIILLVIAAAILTLPIAKLASFCRGFAAHTRYICREMDHADNYEEYRKWRGELRCHYLCLIPFVNGKNVMRLYNRIYHRADKVKKERKDSLVPLLLPSLLGIFICTVCVCGMTWAWYTASVETPTQKLTSACYEVTVESVTGADGTEISPIENGSYSLAQGNTYTVILTASGTVKECGGYCLIQNDAGDKTYTQTFKPGESITVQFKPNTSGSYTFSGVWGSLPTGTAEYLHHTDAVTDPVSDNGDTPAQSDPTGQPSEPTTGTYTVQSGDTLSAIAESFHTTADKIAAYNGIKDKGDIKAGQVLRIPPEDYVIPETTAPQEPIVSEEPAPIIAAEPSQEPSPEPPSDSQSEALPESAKKGNPTLDNAA